MVRTTALGRPVLANSPSPFNQRKTKENNVRNKAIFGAIFAMGAFVAVAQAKTYEGEIMDSGCAKSGSHAQMEKEHNVTSDSACTKACVKAGAKYVLFMNGKAYELDDQTKPADFAGKRVKVNGKMEKDNTIKVDSISPAS